MNSPNYLYYVPEDLAKEMIAKGVVHEDTNIDRRFCTCGHTEWGWGIHAKSCPIYRYYVYGGLRAEEVLLAIQTEFPMQGKGDDNGTRSD